MRKETTQAAAEIAMAIDLFTPIVAEENLHPTFKALGCIGGWLATTAWGHSKKRNRN